MNSLNIILSLTILFPVLTGVRYYPALNAAGRVVVWIMALGLAAEVGSILFAVVFGNNIIIAYMYTSFVAILLCLLFEFINVRAAALLVVPIIAIVEGNLNGTHTFNSFSLTTLNVLAIVHCCLAYYKIMRGEIEENIFPFLIVLFFYSFSTIIFFITASYLQVEAPNMLLTLFNVHSWINASVNLAYTITIWMLYKQFSFVRSRYRR